MESNERRNRSQGKAAMRMVLLAMMCAGLACAAPGQEAGAVQAATAACGPVQQKFTVSTVAEQAGAGDGGATARIVIAQPGDAVGFDGQTFRVGVDGAWVTAVRDYSWQSFTVAPGLHHVCVNWESHLRSLARKFALTSVQAEAGKTYYLELSVAANGGRVTAFNLFGIDADEGKYLVASLPHAVAHLQR